MKLFFIYTNIDGYHENCYSFGLASIVAMARSRGHECKVSVVRERSKFDEVLNEVAAYGPALVGFSSVSSQFSYVKDLAKQIKKRNNNIYTVCGGVHPTINPECIKESGSLDAIFIGESEYSFVEFLDRLEKGESYKDVDNIAYLDNGAVKVNKLKPLLKSLDPLPFPDKEICPFGDTIESTRLAPFMFSRGCPFQCTYCSNHAIAERYGAQRNMPRYRSPESSIQEIESALKNFKIEIVYVHDDIFGLDKGWLQEFCDKYKQRIKLPFTCLIRANLVTEDLIKQLKGAGCFSVQMGVESGNDYVRNEVMKRGMTREQLVKAFGLARKYGMRTVALNVIGAPGETEEMLKDTIALNRELNPTSSGVNIYYPYKGTQLGDHCFNQNMVNLELFNSFSNERRESCLNYPDEYKKILRNYRDNWDKFIYPYDVKRMVLRVFFNRIQPTGVWRFLRKIKRALGFKVRGK
jgi:anaerobic magnesium-protoporphyrin IX monomethyl ester cyclase